jgi:hypothetical protein
MAMNLFIAKFSFWQFAAPSERYALLGKKPKKVGRKKSEIELQTVFKAQRLSNGVWHVNEKQWGRRARVDGVRKI